MRQSMLVVVGSMVVVVWSVVVVVVHPPVFSLLLASRVPSRAGMMLMVVLLALALVGTSNVVAFLVVVGFLPHLVRMREAEPIEGNSVTFCLIRDPRRVKRPCQSVVNAIVIDRANTE